MKKYKVEVNCDVFLNRTYEIEVEAKDRRDLTHKIKNKFADMEKNCISDFDDPVYGQPFIQDVEEI